MRNILSSAAFVRNVADANNGAAPTTEAPAFNAAPTVNSNVATTVAVPKRKRVIAANKPAAAKPSKPEAAKPETTERKPVEIHNVATSYAGASPVLRGHGRKLSPIVLDRVPGSYTDRDHALLKALHGKHGTKPFQRLDIDAGALSRLIGHGALSHVGGQLDMRDCKFVITAKAVKTRLASA